MWGIEHTVTQRGAQPCKPDDELVVARSQHRELARTFIGEIGPTRGELQRSLGPDCIGTGVKAKQGAGKRRIISCRKGTMKFSQPAGAFEPAVEVAGVAQLA